MIFLPRWTQDLAGEVDRSTDNDALRLDEMNGKSDLRGGIEQCPIEEVSLGGVQQRV